MVSCTRRRPRASGCLSLLEVPTVARSRRGLKSGTVQRMLRLAPEAEERASAREERGVRDMEGGGRGSDGEREGSESERREREDSLVENGGTRSSISLSLSSRFSLSLFLCLSISLSPSLFDEEEGAEWLQEGRRALSQGALAGGSTPLVAGKPRRFSRPMQRTPATPTFPIFALPLLFALFFFPSPFLPFAR